MLLYSSHLENLNAHGERWGCRVCRQTFKSARSCSIWEEILILLKKGTLSAGEIGKSFWYDRCNYFLSLKFWKRQIWYVRQSIKTMYYELNISQWKTLCLVGRFGKERCSVWKSTEEKLFQQVCSSDGSSDCNRLLFMEPARHDSDVLRLICRKWVEQ